MIYLVRYSATDARDSETVECAWTTQAGAEAYIAEQGPYAPRYRIEEVELRDVGSEKLRLQTYLAGSLPRLGR